jgi:hypothetical protein
VAFLYEDKKSIPYEYELDATNIQYQKIGDLFLENSMDDKFYVYAHFIPHESEPFYIGRGCRKRAYSHQGRNKWWNNIVKKYGYEVKILYENLSNEQANELEKQLINQYGRKNTGTGCLVNMTDGGDAMIGLIITDVHRERNSQALKNLGELHPAKRESWRLWMRENGPSKRLEVREKISENNSMKNPDIVAKLKNRKRSDETKKKISEANSKRIRTEESKEKTRQSLKKYHEKLKESDGIDIC